MNVKEVVSALSERDITHSEEMVKRWIRNGVLKATKKSEYEGYEISERDLANFIWKINNDTNKDKYYFLEEFEKNRMLEKEVQKLKQDKLDLINKLKEQSSKLAVLSSNQSTDVKTLFGDKAETKKVFKEVLNKIHPDNNGDEEVFKKINKLYKETFR